MRATCCTGELHWHVFADFLEAGALALSNAVDFRHRARTGCPDIVRGINPGAVCSDVNKDLMGYHKDRLIQEDEQRWRFTNSSVCDRCLADPFLRQLARDHAKGDECSFCGRRGRTKPIAVPFDEIMEVIARAVFQYWNHAENEAIAWDQEDQNYVGTTYDTWDIVHDEIPTPSHNPDVMQEIMDSLGDNVWCEKTPDAITGVERYTYSWEEFCKTVKYKVRYFFEAEEEEEFSDTIPVPEMLDALRDIIESAGLIVELPEGTQLFRIRVHRGGEVCDDWRALGSPPPDRCPSNRMSAAGISVFYGALDLLAARAETMANVEPGDRRRFTVGMWTNTRPLKILDLTRLPEIPSFYAEWRYDRDHLVFLRQFVREISQPVVHDGREHIDYVPTQILTEYFRHRYRAGEDTLLDGIIYPSAQRKRGRSIVIFASQDDLNPREHEPWARKTPILRLDLASIRRVPKPRRRTPPGVQKQAS